MNPLLQEYEDAKAGLDAAKVRYDRARAALEAALIGSNGSVSTTASTTTAKPDDQLLNRYRSALRGVLTDQYQTYRNLGDAAGVPWNIARDVLKLMAREGEAEKQANGPQPKYRKAKGDNDDGSITPS